MYSVLCELYYNALVTSEPSLTHVSVLEHPTRRPGKQIFSSFSEPCMRAWRPLDLGEGTDESLKSVSTSTPPCPCRA